MTELLLSINNVGEDGDNMAKKLRMTYILARMLNNLPDEEPYEEFAVKHGLPRALSVKKLCNMEDMKCGLAYRIAKAFGYQLIVYNPNPPKGMDKMYVVGEDKSPIVPREHLGKNRLRKDEYTNTVYRVPRKYKKKLRMVTHNAEKRS